MVKIFFLLKVNFSLRVISKQLVCLLLFPPFRVINAYNAWFKILTGAREIISSITGWNRIVVIFHEV